MERGLRSRPVPQSARFVGELKPRPKDGRMVCGQRRCTSKRFSGQADGDWEIAAPVVCSGSVRRCFDQHCQPFRIEVRGGDVEERVHVGGQLAQPRPIARQRPTN